MQKSSDEFDARIRDGVPKAPPLPSDFQDRVWGALQIQEQALPISQWLEGTFLASVPSSRLVGSCGLLAVLISGFFGVWLGSEVRPEVPESALFSSLQSPPRVTMFDH